MTARGLVVTALVAALVACGEGGSDRGGRGAGADTIAEAAYTSRPGMSPYREVELTGMGRLEGEVRLESSARDTLILVTRNADLCGERVAEGAIVAPQGGLMNVVVWLTDAREGKPFPDSRRFEVTNLRCRLDPRVQGVIVGGTLNVKSADPVVHETVIRVSGVSEVLETVTQNGDGQVVPLEKVLARPVRLELSCRTHPWTQGWIHVFDHPYFVISAPNGRFVLDSIPPGEYTMQTWHERLGRTTREIKVENGGITRVEVKY
ncbi:MAG TPA: hypothetical protein VJ650_15205 [Gemmatimonadaceae bacterium]|nr:hypothetical protein [Gemmatimonadaceae bacterium]